MGNNRFNLLRNIRFEYRITFSYLLFGLLWILFSDKVLDLLVQDDSLLTQFQTYKGAFFILVTSAFLYFFVKRHMKSLRDAETKLLESEKHYKALFNNNHSAILLINPSNGRIEDANPAACHYYGWTHAELCSKSVYELNSTDKDAVKIRLRAVEKEDLNHFFTQHLLAGGEKREVEVFSSPICIRNKNMIYSSIHDITEQKKAEIALNKSEELLRKFASHLQNVREEEKVALAREIHDELGQTLVALKIDMGLLKNRIIKNNDSDDLKDTVEKFDSILSLTDQTIKTARRIMSGLRPELLEMNGFLAAATSYLVEFESRYKIQCEFISEIHDIEMNPQQSLVFFRIFQESLNNIAKHSGATIVKVCFRIENEKLILEIDDNGRGFDRQTSGRRDSYGMLGMKERAVLLNGELFITSEPGKGTRVHVEIPWKQS